MEILNIEITDISDMGQGIGRIDNLVTFVEGALPGDYAAARISQKKKKYIKASLVEILKESPYRVQPQCEFTETCGGCPLMPLDYDKQLNIKMNQIRDKLVRIGGFDPDNVNSVLNSVLPMEAPYNYRNKVEFTVTEKGKVGFYKPGTKQIVDISLCQISSKSANIILKSARKYFAQNKNSGVERITVRNSFTTGEVMVILQIPGRPEKNHEYLYPLVETFDDDINSLSEKDEEWGVSISLESVYVYNPEKQKKPYTLVAGKPTIEDEQSGLIFEISPTSFYQTNPAQTTKLFEKVAEYTDFQSSDNVFDLYCGVGSIGLTLSDKVSEITGVESVKDAVLDANRNAVINGIVNTRYIHGKAEDVMDTLNMTENTTVIVDPPRAGLKPRVVCAIGESKSNRLVYVSCDPGTMARDLKGLSEFGYSIIGITPVDMFPHTSHVECVVLMSRVSG